MLYDYCADPTNSKETCRRWEKLVFCRRWNGVVFSTYAIAPYAAGDIEITVPYEELSTIVKDQYLYPGTQFTVTNVCVDGSSAPYEITQTQALQEAQVWQNTGSRIFLI